MQAGGADGGLNEFQYLRLARLLHTLDILALHPLAKERRGCDGERATRRLEGDVFDDALRINAELKRQMVAAERICGPCGVARFLSVPKFIG